jgi:hypothetical protein
MQAVSEQPVPETAKTVSIVFLFRAGIQHRKRGKYDLSYERRSVVLGRHALLVVDGLHPLHEHVVQ